MTASNDPGRSRSRDAAGAPGGKAMLEKIMPELPLSDVTAGVADYRDVFGFHVISQPWGLREFGQPFE